MFFIFYRFRGSDIRHAPYVQFCSFFTDVKYMMNESDYEVLCICSSKNFDATVQLLKGV